MLPGQSINSNSTNDLKMSNWDAKIQLGIEPQYFHCLLTKSEDCAWGRVGKNGLDWGRAEVGKRAKRCKKRPRKMHIWWWLNRHHSIQNSSRCAQSYFQGVIRPKLGNVLWGPVLLTHLCHPGHCQGVYHNTIWGQADRGRGWTHNLSSCPSTDPFCFGQSLTACRCLLHCTTQAGPAV